MENNRGVLYVICIMMGMAIALLICKHVSSGIEEKSIKDYIQHPENYELRYTYVKGDSTPVDLTVIKKEK